MNMVTIYGSIKDRKFCRPAEQLSASQVELFSVDLVALDSYLDK